MGVSVVCTCGKRLKAKESAAGRTANCPACGQPVTFPALKTQAGDSLLRGLDVQQDKPVFESSRKVAEDMASATMPNLDEFSYENMVEPRNESAAADTAYIVCPFCSNQAPPSYRKCNVCGAIFSEITYVYKM